MNTISKLPFHKFCISIGAIPTTYIESLSYYEQMLWLCKFLEEQVIPTVNNNGQAVTELQNLFQELQNYIANYFDNLDVQEEINNKLDKMVEDGILENILMNYTKVQKIYDTFQDVLLDNNIKNNMKIRTLGYYNINDGGDGEYYITDLQNNYYYQILKDNLYITLIAKNEFHVKQFGAYGNNVNNDTLAFNTCSRFCELLNKNMIIDNGTYLINDTIEMPINVDIISKNAIINTNQINGDVISCNKDGYITGNQPKYTMKGNLTINANAINNNLIGLHIGASKKSIFENILITNCLNAGILIKSVYSGDIDNFNINLCHCYNTGGIIIESGTNEITNGSITDGSIRNCIIDSPLQKSAITINKNSNKSIFGIKFERNFLNSSNYPVLSINNNSNSFIYYLKFDENSVEIRNSQNNPIYAVINGVSNSIFDLQGQLNNTSGFDINNCKNCVFKRIEYTGYLGLNDKIIDFDANSYNNIIENLTIPFIDFWYNTEKNYNAQLKSKWNELFIDNGYNNKIINSLPFNNIISSINNFNNILSLANENPNENYSLRFSTATKDNNQLNLLLQNSQNSPRIEMPIFNCKNQWVGVHIRYKLNSAFNPVDNAKLQLIPFNNFNIILDTEINKWYDVCLIVPYSKNKSYFGINGYINSDLNITIDKFEIIDNFELPYFNNYKLIQGEQ